MKVLVLGNMADLQTGPYIAESFKELKNKVAVLDIRNVVKILGREEGQKRVVSESQESNLGWCPELIVVMKGLELEHETVEAVKKNNPNAVLVNWFFDVYLQDKPIWEREDYFPTLKLYDYYFCSLKGVADKLNELGFNNAKYLDEACFPPWNKEVYMNAFQEKKYGEDISFCGSLGMIKQHKMRLETLTKLADEGFNLKIWGDVICDWKHIPQQLKMFIASKSVVNEDHSKVCQASLINLGIDQDVNIDMGHSARVYRVLCAGGLYLSNATKGLDRMFKVNKKGEPITADQEIVLYYDLNDLIDKCDFLLEHEDIRKSIAKNGQRLVLEKHKFTDRVKELLEIIEKKGE